MSSRALSKRDRKNFEAVSAVMARKGPEMEQIISEHSHICKTPSTMKGVL